MEKLTLSVVLGAALGSGFKSVFGSARTELSTLGQEIQKTTKLGKQVMGMGDATINIQRLTEKLKVASTEALRLEAAIKKDKEAGKAMAPGIEKALQGAVNETNRLEKALFKEQKQLQGVGDALRKAGVDTQNLGAEYARLDQALDKQTAAFLRRKQVMEDRGAARDTMKGEVLKIGASITYLTTATNKAINFESAMADVRKVVNFESPAQFKEMGSDILKLSTRLPMTAEGIAAIVAAGGQAGFARKELLLFAEDAGKMGIAFDTTADDAGQMMAQWRTSFKMGQDQVRGLADQINYLGNNSPANAKKISDIVTRIGPLGEVSGVASGQIAALGATVAGMGIAPEIAATGIKNMMLALNSGSSATKSQLKAFDALGLSAEDMAKRMQVDASGAITEVLQNIRDLPKEEQAAALDNLFGKESIAAIAPMLTNLDLLQQNLQRVGDETKYAGSMQKEFESRAGTTKNGLTLLGASYDRLSIIIGNVFNPAVELIAGVIGDALNVVANLADEFPLLTAVVVTGATAWIGYRTAVAVANFAMTFIPGAAAVSTTALSTLGTVARLTTGIFTFMAGAARFLWGVLMANPIILIGAAIAGAAYLIYKNWEPIKTFFSGLWSGISAGIGDAVDWIISKLSTLTSPIKWVMEKGAMIGSALGLGTAASPAAGPGSPAGAATGAQSTVRRTAAAAVVATAAATTPAAAKTVQVQQTNAHQITVTAAPGQNSQDIAKAVSQEIQRLDREKAAKKRGGLYDSKD